MGVTIDIKRPDFQEGLDMLEGILDLGLVPISADDLPSGKNEGFTIAVGMVGDKNAQTVQSFGKGDLCRLLLD